jgi:hypothetical protein
MQRFFCHLCVSSLLLFAGCATMNAAERTKDLKIGMTRDQVVQVLGVEPVSSTAQDGKTILKFSLHETWKGTVPYYMTFDKDARLESWRADEEEFKRNQEAMAKMWGVNSEQTATAPAGAPSPGQSAAPPTVAAGPNDAGLQRWMAGRYMSYSGSTSRTFVLSATGRFIYNTESSYSGREGQVGGAWGAASQSGNAGTWAIQGDRTQGKISLRYNSGKQETITYQAGRENGVFLFNGITFAYESAAD